MAEQKRIRTALRVPAKTWNAFVEAANAESVRRLNRDVERLQPTIHVATAGKARNNEAGAMERFSAVELREPIIGPTDRLPEFHRIITFEAHTPTLLYRNEQPNRVGILLEPLRPGAIGNVALAGIVPCLVDMQIEGDRFADLTIGETHLTSAANGPVEILWAEAGTGLKWAWVRFGTWHTNAVVEITNGTADGSGRFSCFVEKFDATTLTLFDREQAYAWDMNGGDSLTVGSRFDAIFSGYSSGRPIYLIRATGSQGDTTIGGDLTVQGDTTLNGTLYLQEQATYVLPPPGSFSVQIVNGQLIIVSASGALCRLCGQAKCCCAAECTPAKSSIFTWVNQGNAELIENDNETFTLHDPSGSVLPDLHLLVVGLPDPPYQVTAKVIATLPTDAGKPTFGLAWRETSSGKLAPFKLTLNASGIVALGVDPSHDSLWLSSEKWGGPATPDSVYKQTGSGMAQAVPVFLRLEDDGTNRKASYSGDGMHFTEFDSQARGDYFDAEADQAGIFIDASEGTGSAFVTVCCWIVGLGPYGQGIEIWGTAEVHEGDYEAAEQGIEVWGTAEAYEEDYEEGEQGIEVWGEAEGPYVGDYLDAEQGIEVWGEADVYQGEPPPVKLCVSANDPDEHLTKTLSQDGNLFQWESDEFEHDSEQVHWYLTYTSDPSPTWTLELIGASVVATYTASGTLSDPTTFTLSDGTDVPEMVSLSLDECPIPTTDECTECPEAPITWETDSPEMGSGDPETGGEPANATLTHATDCTWTSGNGWTLLYIEGSDLWRLDWNSIEAWTLAGAEWDCLGVNVMTHATLSPITLTPGGAP